MKVKLLPFDEVKTNYNDSVSCDFDVIYGITKELWEKIRKYIGGYKNGYKH